MIGVGVYALSEEGRGRFEEFPDVIADDGYVRMLFSSSERVHVDDAPVRVYAPARVSDLMRIKTRSRLGRYQLQAALPRPRRARADDEVLPRRNADDRRSDPGSGRPRRSTRSSSSRLAVARAPSSRRSTTTSGNAISRHVDPTGADANRSLDRLPEPRSSESVDAPTRAGPSSVRPAPPSATATAGWARHEPAPSWSEPTRLTFARLAGTRSRDGCVDPRPAARAGALVGSNLVVALRRLPIGAPASRRNPRVSCPPSR